MILQPTVLLTFKLPLLVFFLMICCYVHSILSKELKIGHHALRAHMDVSENGVCPKFPSNKWENKVLPLLGRNLIMGLCGAVDTISSQAAGAGRLELLGPIFRRSCLFLLPLGLGREEGAGEGPRAEHMSVGRKLVFLKDTGGLTC